MIASKQAFPVSFTSILNYLSHQLPTYISIMYQPLRNKQWATASPTQDFTSWTKLFEFLCLPADVKWTAFTSCQAYSLVNTSPLAPRKRAFPILTTSGHTVRSCKSHHKPHRSRRAYNRSNTKVENTLSADTGANYSIFLTWETSCTFKGSDAAGTADSSRPTVIDHLPAGLQVPTFKGHSCWNCLRPSTHATLQCHAATFRLPWKQKLALHHQHIAPPRLI